MPLANTQEPVLNEISIERDMQSQQRRSLRICMVTYSFYETDSRVIRYAEALVQRGDQVDVFALRKTNTPRTEILSGVRVRRIQGRSFNETGRLSYVWRTVVFLVRALFQISVADFSQKYDILHIHSVPDFLVFSALVPRLRGTPVILDIRDILPEFYASKFGVSHESVGFRFLCLIEWLCARFASHIISANQTWRDRLLLRSVRPGGCTLVLNVPDRSIFRRTPPPPSNNARDRFLLLYHGTLNRHQGLDLAIRAFAKIKDVVPEADFHIYGDGPSKPELLSLIDYFHLEGRVVLHERKPLREISDVLQNARLGIVPKRKDGFGNEAFSTKILEFMAMGVPVIVSDTDVDRQYFDDSVVRFFRGGDENDLACCMLDLIRHPETRRLLSERAASLVDQYDWTIKREEYLKLVDGLLSRNA